MRKHHYSKGQLIWVFFHIKSWHFIRTFWYCAFEQSQCFFTHVLRNNRAAVKINKYVLLKGPTIHNVIIFYISMDNFELMEKFDWLKEFIFIQVNRPQTSLHWKLNAIFIDNEIEPKKSRYFRSDFHMRWSLIKTVLFYYLSDYPSFVFFCKLSILYRMSITILINSPKTSLADFWKIEYWLRRSFIKIYIQIKLKVGKVNL